MKILKKRSLDVTDLDKLQGTEAMPDAIRQLRRPLLDAFDKYKTNIGYGVISETADTHAQVVDWYRRLLDLDPEAIATVPDAIKPYV